jgi:hypothetical protein
MERNMNTWAGQLENLNDDIVMITRGAIGDRQGNVAGVIVSKLEALRLGEATRDLPGIERCGRRPRATRPVGPFRARPR